MRTIYRTTFELRAGAQCDDFFGSFADAAWAWLYDRRELGLARKPTGMSGAVAIPSTDVGNGFRAEALHVDTTNSRGWALLVSQKDAREYDLLWVSDLALLREADGKHYFSFTQSLGRTDGGIMPIRRTPGRPRIIAKLVKQFIASSGGLRLHSRPLPLRLTETDLKQFIALLERPERTHPIVLVSIHRQSGKPLINPGELADHLSGVAHVIVAESADVATNLSRILPPWLTCFDGAVRVYWPGFRRISQTIDHRLWTVRDLSAEHIQFNSGRFADLVLASIAEVTVNSISPHYCSFDRLQSLDRHRVIAAAKDNQEWEKLALAYAADCEAKDAAVVSLERELQSVSEALFREQQLTVALKASIEERKAGRTHEAETQLPPESVVDAIERAKQQFGDQLVFSLNGKSDERSPFESPSEVLAAFEWLAVVYRDSKTGAKSCPDLDKDLRETITGWHYSAHQNESTARSHRAKDWYQCPWAGSPTGKLEIHEHIKCGRSRDAEETIRIAFSWEPKIQKVVIGFIGQHQRNAHTN